MKDDDIKTIRRIVREESREAQKSRVFLYVMVFMIWWATCCNDRPTKRQAELIEKMTEKQ